MRFRLPVAAVAFSAAVAVAGLGLGISSASASAAPSRFVPACTAGDLGVWVAIDQGNGTAGSVYYPLQFTNLGGHACTLHGFPGVSAISGSGHQLGSPAGWGHVSVPRTVVLAAGATAHTELRWTDVTVFPASSCRPTSAAVELRVYPPNQRSSTDAEFGLEACSHAGPVYLSVGPIIPGVGTING